MLPLALLIPAYKPGPGLPGIISALREQGWRAIVVVDDGSGAEFPELDGVELVRHAVNLGKGAAIKTGLNQILCNYPDVLGVVTADADGQHAPEDIRRVGERLAENSQSLVLGVRGFEQDVPWRSRVGNRLSSLGVRLILGEKLADTQTGLRGIPAHLIPQLLKIPAPGYEFELDMLTAARHSGISIAEVPIRTIYTPGNRTSHFNPVVDSMRISFVLLRFTAVSLVTSAIDNAVFWVLFPLFGTVAPAQFVARCAAMAFNYPAARRAVFLSHERHSVTLPKYLVLVAAAGLASYALIGLLATRLGVLAAKLVAESVLFLANFAIQRDLVFTRTLRTAATDWDRYYREIPWTAKLTRRYTARALVDVFNRFAGNVDTLVEFGGANSCFLEKIRAEIKPTEYHVVDTNRYGLNLLAGTNGVILHLADCRDPALDISADAVFSVGLIEHFTPEETRRAIDGHFATLKPGGCAILSFPTPTWLYRSARRLAEAAGVWRFPDERPLDPSEVAAAARAKGEILFERTLWPLVFTQHLMVVRKRA